MGLFQSTSEVLPPTQFPQFTSQGAAELEFEGNPFAPFEGEAFAGALHQDSSYMRLTRTIDLSEVPAADQPRLQFALSINTEPSYDNVIVEAHTPGEDNWTTLPDLNGRTQTDPPAECTGTGFLLALHPFLRHYLGGADCSSPGTSGTWNSFTGSLPGGWHQAAVDLSAYAGEQVEVSITYVTDPGAGGIGAFLDDTRLVTNSATLFTDGFEGETALDRRPGASGQPAERGSVGDRTGAAGVLRRHVHQRHAAARLRARAGRHRRRPRPARPAGAGGPGRPSLALVTLRTGGRAHMSTAAGASSSIREPASAGQRRRSVTWPVRSVPPSSTATSRSASYAAAGVSRRRTRLPQLTRSVTVAPRLTSVPAGGSVSITVSSGTVVEPAVTLREASSTAFSRSAAADGLRPATSGTTRAAALRRPRP